MEDKTLTEDEVDELRDALDDLGTLRDHLLVVRRMSDHKAAKVYHEDEGDMRRAYALGFMTGQLDIHTRDLSRLIHRICSILDVPDPESQAPADIDAFARRIEGANG